MQSNQTVKTNYFLIKPCPSATLGCTWQPRDPPPSPGSIWSSWGWPHCRPQRRPAQIWMRQLVLGRPPWQFWIEGGIGPRDASTTPIGPQRTAHLAAVEKTCTPSEIKEVNSCYSLCLKKLFVTNSEKEKNNFQIWHAHHKATGMTIFCWAKTISNNSLILTNYFEKHLKLTHWYDGPIWMKPLKEVFFRSARASWNT